MKFAAHYGRTVTDEDGSLELTLTISGNDKFMAQKAIEKAKTYERLTVDLSQYRKARSLDANAFMWALLGHLSKILLTTDIELYRLYVRECGVWTDFEMPERTAKTFMHLWQERGLAWMVDRMDEGQDTAIIRAYYGSSSYNTAQMARLLDRIITDAKEAGIEVSTDEVKSLMEAWDEKRSTK